MLQCRHCHEGIHYCFLAHIILYLAFSAINSSTNTRALCVRNLKWQDKGGYRGAGCVAISVRWSVKLLLSCLNIKINDISLYC